jgi:hypothetical protein
VATYNGARIDQINELISRFTFDAEQLPFAMENAMFEAGWAGVGRMEVRIKDAITETGVKRALKGGKGPGRIKTGGLINSLTADDGTTVRSSVYGTKVRAEFGYLQAEEAGPDSREYKQAMAQELEYYTISGSMLALQLGFNVFMQHIYTSFAQEWRDLDNAAKAKQFQTRANRARGAETRHQVFVTKVAPEHVGVRVKRYKISKGGKIAK